MKYLLILAFAVVCLGYPGTAKCGEPEVRKRVIAAWEKHESIPFAKMNGTLYSRVGLSDFSFETIDEKFYLSIGPKYFKTAKELEAWRKEQVQEQGTKVISESSPQLFAFDGRRNFEFFPAQYLVRVLNVPEPRFPAVTAQLCPRNWSKYRGLLKFSAIFEGLDYADEGNGRAKFSKTFPKTNPPQYYESISIATDENQGDHITRVDTHGGVVGETILDLQWAVCEGVWYPCKGEYRVNGEVLESWEIQEITFQRSRVRQSFEIKVDQLPFGTEIWEQAMDSKESTTRYVGGELGKRENRLQREISILEKSNKRD